MNQQIASRFDAPSSRVESGLFSDQLPADKAECVWHCLIGGNAKDTEKFQGCCEVHCITRSLFYAL